MNAAIRKRAPSSRRAEAKALFRNAILDAAEEVFAEKGFHAARIQDIAARARTGVGTVYNHFEQKEDVLVALLDERTRVVVAAIEPRPGDGKDFERRARAQLARMLAALAKHRAFFGVAFEYGLIGPASAAGALVLKGRRVKQPERFRAAMLALLEDGVASGALAPRQPVRLVRFLGGALRAFMLDPQSTNEPFDPEERAAQVVDLFLHGAARRGR